jgi:adenylate cyclase
MSESPSNEQWWREYLEHGHRLEGAARRLFPFLPSPPRCKICYVPFGGVAGSVMRVLGWTPSRKNPNLCTRCCERLPPGGAETDIAVFFADVRNYTGFAEKLPPAQLARTMNGFYQAAIQTVIHHDGLVDKLLGDAVMALFVPGVSGPSYRLKALRATAHLMRQMNDKAIASSLAIGIGIHAGPAFVGNLGSDKIVDLTAIGDTVNVASRLQGAAAPGEILITEELYALAAQEFGNLAARTVTLKGKEQPMTVRVLRLTH